MISGPSGCGKSRLLRAIADLDSHEGQLSCEGVPAEQLPAWQWRRRVAMLAAESAWWRERVADHFVRPPSMERLAALALGRDMGAEPVARLSSGERQRLAMLRLLANNPRVLLLDEPTANLDAANVARVEDLVAAYLAEHDAAALWVSHDAQQIARLATRHARLEAGRLEGDPSP
jgi:ABC-type iron transport system FetAB ATPase subunit